jgi:copper transport protein
VIRAEASARTAYHRQRFNLQRLIASVALAWAVLGTAAPVAAHAVLVAAEPAAGTRVERAPQTVTLTFDEAVETTLGSLRVLDGAGTVRSVGPVTHPDGDARRVSVRIGNVERGRYIVAWQVVSADSHLVDGAYAFGIGAGAGDAPVLPADNGATLLLPILHFMILAGALLGIGLPVGAATIGRAAARAPSFVEFGAWIVLAFAAFADIAFRADLAGGTLATALATRIGVLRLVTVAASLAGVLALTGRARRWLLLVPACLATTISLSLAGHAAGGGIPAIGVSADALHLLAAASWIGVLATGTTLEATAGLRGISAVAATAVGVLVVSGIVQTVRNVGSVAALVSTTYGRLIDVKIVLLLLSLGLAVSARRLLARGSFTIGGRLKAELWLLTAVIAVTAVLVESPLPREAAVPPSVAASFAVRDIAVKVTATALDEHRWAVRIDASGPLDEADVSAAQPRQHVGPLNVPMTHSAPGTFSGAVTLPFGGEWRLLASVRSGAFDEAHRTLTLPETSREP